jgi:hypothetical protein
MSWGGWLLPIWFELLLMVGIAAITMAAAVWQFTRPG